MQGTEKICVAKPVASKPLSKVIFYPQFMAEAKISQTSAPSEKTIAIKPKTVRLRSWPSSAPETVPPKNSGIASSEKGSATNLAADFRSSILYKPTAKVASATKAPPLANLETFDAYFHENMHSQAPIYEPNLSNQHTTNQHQNSYSYADVSQICEPSNATSQDMELDMKIRHHSGDKLSYDGYNWRKYGQKQVKGSEYPRSYYKCTHPNCPVKKNVERSLAGQIAEIVYKGEHNHPKLPRSLKRLSSNSQGQADVSDEQGRGDDLLQTISSGWNTSAGVMNNNCNEVGVHLAANCARRTNDQTCKGGSRVVNVTGDKVNHKRRDDNQVCGANTARTDGAGCNHTTQHCTDTEISGDGFQWRKYGQKVVKGNSHPRGYYRCTTPRCNVRKYVERATDESGSLVTRYEGMHNHHMPTKR